MTELIQSLTVMEQTWELIFSKVTGPNHSKLVFDFGQLPRKNGTNYSLRITCIRNNQSRWISLNPKEINWLMDNMYYENAGRKFRSRSISLSRIPSGRTAIVKINQTRNNRTSSVTLPLNAMDTLFKTLYQAENILRILNDGIGSLPFVEPSEWKQALVGIIIYHYIQMKIELLPPESREQEDIGESMADEMIIQPFEVLDHIMAFFGYFNIDIGVPYSASELTQAAHETSGLYKSVYNGFKVNELNDHFPDIIKMMLEVRVGDIRPNWAFSALRIEKEGEH